MSWNEIKFQLAPIGSKIYGRRDRSQVTSDGYSVTVVTIHPPVAVETERAKLKNLEEWLRARSFSNVKTDQKKSHYELNDVSVRVDSDGSSVTGVRLNCSVGLDLRARLPVWEELIVGLCGDHNLRLIDLNSGLVGPDSFMKLAKESFAWECFLQREMPQKSS